MPFGTRFRLGGFWSQILSLFGLLEPNFGISLPLEPNFSLSGPRTHISLFVPFGAKFCFESELGKPNVALSKPFGATLLLLEPNFGLSVCGVLASIHLNLAVVLLPQSTETSLRPPWLNFPDEFAKLLSNHLLNR